jgi:hypothetical protein
MGKGAGRGSNTDNYREYIIQTTDKNNQAMTGLTADANDKRIPQGKTTMKEI